MVLNIFILRIFMVGYSFEFVERIVVFVTVIVALVRAYRNVMIVLGQFLGRYSRLHN